MNDLNDLLDILSRCVRYSQGEFSLTIVRCNYIKEHKEIAIKLKQKCEFKIHQLTLNTYIKDLYLIIKQELDHQNHEEIKTLIIHGFERVDDLDCILTGINQARNRFQKNFPLPIIFFVTDKVLQKLIKTAPDFYSCIPPAFEFHLESNNLIALIEKSINTIIDKVLNSGDGRFLDNTILDLNENSIHLNELNSAYKELQNRGVNLSTEVQAGLEFVWGRSKQGNSTEAKQNQEARQHYEKSLELCYRHQESGKSSEFKSIERLGCVLFSLGIWWGAYAERHLTEYEKNFNKAKDYFEQCVEVFRQGKKLDLVAKFINALALALHKLKDWDALETTAQEGLKLNEKSQDLFRLAQAYGFLAAVELHRNNWNKANKLANKALEILKNKSDEIRKNSPLSEEKKADLDWEISYNQAWYLFALARAKAGLGLIQTATKSLEKSRESGKPEYDPRLYIHILEKLQSLYFEQGEYHNAFHVKQEQRSIEQQYGFRAFIGAGRLQPERQVINPALPKVGLQETIAQEISKSGRQQDINKLVQHIRRSDAKLTVIYGQSGVGKSSLLQAGLIPTLKQIFIESYRVIPVLVKVYPEAIENLGISLKEALATIEGYTPENSQLNSQEEILSQLRKNYQKKLVTVLIMDNFEIFLSSKKEDYRKNIFLFLKKCLDVPFTKVVISLREDYIHFLLRWDRIAGLDVVNNNVLDKKNLYYLDNYSKKNAKHLIQELTRKIPFSLEKALIDTLVEDLAGESDKIRPIELQLVGYQLETEGITTLQEYQKLAQNSVSKNVKEKMIGRFLEDVIKACGPENDEIARLVLHLLTDKNKSRPARTLADLESYIGGKGRHISLVLKILTDSWLVFEEPGWPDNSYRLAHDYLVPFIRQDENFHLREELRQTKEQLAQSLHQAQEAKKITEIAEVEALSLLAFNKFLMGDQLGAVVRGFKAGKKLSNLFVDFPNKPNTLNQLKQVIYGARELNRIEEHNRGFWDVSFSQDGQILAAASSDETVKLWRLDGSKIRTFEGHTDWVWSVAFSSDDQMIASTSDDKTVKVWKLDGTEIITFRGHTASVKSVCFSPDNQIVASASDDHTVKLWKLDGTEILTFDQHTASVNSVRFSPDGSLLASGSDDHTVKFWRRRNGELKTTLSGHQDEVVSVRFSPDGRMLASASSDQTVKLWQLDGTNTFTFQGHNAPVTSVRFSRNGELIASTSADGMIKIWRPDGTEVQTLQGHQAGVRGISFGFNDNILASASGDGTVRLWKITGTAWKTLNGSGCHHDWVWGVSFSPDGKMLASGSADKTVKLWQVNHNKVQTLKEHSDLVRGVSFSPDGKMLASGSADETVRIVRFDGGKPEILEILRGHRGKVWGVDFDPTSHFLASASDDTTVRVWQLRTSQDPMILTHSSRVRSVRFHPQGHLLATGCYDGSIHLWQLDGRKIRTFQGHSLEIRSLSFHPDGNTLASASPEKVVKLWRLDGTEVQTFQGHSAGIWSVSFRPHDQMLASASADGTVRLWQLDGTQIQLFQGHNSAVLSICFSDDGQMLASASADRTIKIWRLDKMQPQAADLEGVLAYGCKWLRDYLSTNPNVSPSDRTLCDLD